MNKIELAGLFVINAHRGQVRKYTGEPYYFHCFEVANMVKNFGGTDEQIIAALLHDTVEDTDVTFQDVAKEFGPLVLEYVMGLTDVSKPSDGNRATRKNLDRLNLSKQCKAVQDIKVCDLISNSLSIKEHDPKFWVTYKKEKMALLDSLHLADTELKEGALGICTVYE